MKIDIAPLSIDKAVRCTLTNDAGGCLTLTNFGAAIVSLQVPDRAGHSEHVALAYENYDEFWFSPQYFGKTVGRTAGRIPNSILKIGHETYALDSAFGRHTLHGGRHSLAYKLFSFQLLDFGAETKVRFRYTSPFGEGGYPGQVRFEITYTFFDSHNEILIEYRAETDFPTPINLTNHAYFNLTGAYKKDIRNHVLKMNTPVFFDIDEELILTQQLPVTKTMDFRKGMALGKHIEAEYLQSSKAFGYDHTFKTSGEGVTIVLFDPDSGRRLTMTSDYPAVNVYTDNYPSGKTLLGGMTDTRYLGVAIEPEFVPTDVDSYLVHPEDAYAHYIRLNFDTIE